MVTAGAWRNRNLPKQAVPFSLLSHELVVGYAVGERPALVD